MYLDMETEEEKVGVEMRMLSMGPSSLCVSIYHLIPYFTLTDLSKAGLFSAAVASLISLSIQDIRPNSQDTSNFYLDQHGYRRLEPTEHFSHSTKIRSLAEVTSGFELARQYYLCPTCDVATAIGTKIPQCHSTTLQSTRASRGSCILL